MNQDLIIAICIGVAPLVCLAVVRWADRRHNPKPPRPRPLLPTKPWPRC